MEGRAAAALRRVQEQGSAALLVTARPNVRYVTGFSGSSGWALLRDTGVVLITDARYTQQAAAEAPDAEIVIAENGLTRALAALLEASPGARVGFESTGLSYAAAQEVQEATPGVGWQACAGIVERLRSIKDDAEIEAIRRALDVAERALRGVVPAVGPGLSEREMAARLGFDCRRNGADAMSFETIVAAGARGSLPHARPTDAELANGDLLVVDMGCVVDGYRSDITRAVRVGEIDAAWRTVHEALSEAQDAAIGRIEPGIAAQQVDRTAREVLAAHGFAEAFVHSLGHGVGLDVHEAPRLAQTSDEVLRVGMVVTIEPGVYLPGRGGMRLEDMVLITETGAERLNGLSTEIMVAGV